MTTNLPALTARSASARMHDRPAGHHVVLTVNAPRSAPGPVAHHRNIAVVVDPSPDTTSSAATSVACRVAHGLRSGDRISVVSPGSPATTLIERRPWSEQVARDIAYDLYQRERSDRSSLSRAWLDAARHVAADAAERPLARSHVLIIVDAGRDAAVSPAWALHTRELAARGVATSCAFVGEPGDTTAIEALARAANGVCVSGDGEAVSDALLSFLDGQKGVWSPQVRLRIVDSAGGWVTVVGRQPRSREEASDEPPSAELSVSLGCMPFGGSRELVLHTDSAPESLSVTLEWQGRTGDWETAPLDRATTIDTTQEHDGTWVNQRVVAAWKRRLLDRVTLSSDRRRRLDAGTAAALRRDADRLEAFSYGVPGADVRDVLMAVVGLDVRPWFRSAPRGDF